MKWFRFYADVLGDPKVQRLPGDLFKAWVNLLCIACNHDGLIPADLDDLSFEWRCSPLQAREQLDALTRAGLVDKKPTLQPHNWNGRQFKSDVTDPTAAGRMKKYRNAHRNGARNEQRNDERNATRNGDCNATVSVTVLRADTDSDTDSEQNRKAEAPPLQEPPHPKAPTASPHGSAVDPLAIPDFLKRKAPEPSPQPLAPKANGHATAKRGTRLDPDWQPGPDDQAFCQSLGLELAKARAEFVDYWIGIPGSRGLKLDWPATFRNRCRQIHDQGGGGTARPGRNRPNPASIADAFARAARRQT